MSPQSRLYAAVATTPTFDPRALYTNVPTGAKARQTAPTNPPARNEPTPPAAVPNSANRCQPAPPNAPAQNEPTTHRPPRPLTPDQLRAAALWVAGHSTTAIAAALNLNRHTISKWKRRPLFVQELRALLKQRSSNH